MSEEPTPRPRSVPDLDSIEVGGQRLTRVKRRPRSEGAPAPATEQASDVATGPAPSGPIVSLEDLARKHLGPDIESAQVALEEHGDFLRALSEPADHEPAAIADLASRLDLFTDLGGAIPHPETSPDKREGGYLSPIVATDDAPDLLTGRSKPETLFDLFDLFPQLDGVNWWIHVNRKLPKLYSGMNVAGALRRITRALSLSDWQAIYGGGEYELIVYGPPKRGYVLGPDGRVPAKKMTEPILLKFPGIPSLESLVYDDDLEPTDMSQQQHEAFGVPRRPLSIGEAGVEGKKVEVAAEREKRTESREELARKEAKAALEREAASKDGLLGQFMQMQREASEREADLRREMLDREREVAAQRREDDAKWEERIRQLIGEKTPPPDDVERLLKLSSGMNKSGDVDALRVAHEREVKGLMEQRVKDAERADQLVKDERRRADDAIRDAQERADRRIKDAEDRFNTNDRDMRQRATDEVQRSKDDAERRLGDQHRQHETRVTDLDRGHARDIEALKSSHLMTIESLKSTFEMRIETLRGDAKRAQGDADRARTEVEEYKDLGKQINKIKNAAADLGMTDASDAEPAEPETIGQTLLKVGANVAAGLPQIVESLGGMFGKRTDQEIQAARMQGRQDMISQAQLGPGGFAPTPQLPSGHSRRSPRLQAIGSVSPPPLIPGQEPYRPEHTRAESIRPIPTGVEAQPEEIMRQEFLARAQREMPEHAFAPAIPGPTTNPFHTGMPPEPQMAPPSMPPPAHAAPQSMPPGPQTELAVPGADELAAEDEQLLQAEPFILAPFEAGTTPAQVAQQFAATYPKEVIAQLVAQLGSAKRILDAYARRRPAEHAFNGYQGKKFIKKLFEELTKITSG